MLHNLVDAMAIFQKQKQASVALPKIHAPIIGQQAKFTALRKVCMAETTPSQAFKTFRLACSSSLCLSSSSAKRAAIISESKVCCLIRFVCFQSLSAFTTMPLCRTTISSRIIGWLSLSPCVISLLCPRINSLPVTSILRKAF